MGPPSFMGLGAPFPPPGHPPNAPPQTAPAEVVVKRSNSIDSNSNREREQLQQQQQQQQQHQQQLLQQQQQQQQQQQWLAIAAMQQQSQAPHAHPSHPHFTPVTAGYPVATPTSQVPHHEQSQPMVFTFPSQEELALRQRLACPVPSTPEQQHHLATLMQHGVIHPSSLIPGQMEPNRLHEEQHGLATPQPQLVVPGVVTMEQYVALQQQQAALAAGLSPIDNQSLEFQRYFESMVQQVQKDPSLLQHPQVHHLLANGNALSQQIHLLQMAGHDQHQINLVHHQQMARIQQEQMMFQAQAQAAQHEAAQKQKLILSRPPATVADSAPNRSRPGVIMGK